LSCKKLEEKKMTKSMNSDMKLINWEVIMLYQRKKETLNRKSVTMVRY